MLKRIISIIGLFIVFFIWFIWFFMWDPIPNLWFTEVKPGQVWLQETNDPFQDDHEKIILDTKNGYVKWGFFPYKEGDITWSDKERYFKIGMKLIDNPKERSKQ